jgi:hypothetical protein
MPTFTYPNLSPYSHGAITVPWDLQIFLYPTNKDATRVHHAISLWYHLRAISLWYHLRAILLWYRLCVILLWYRLRMNFLWYRLCAISLWYRLVRFCWNITFVSIQFRMVALEVALLRFVGCLFFQRRSFEQAPLHFVGFLFFHPRSFEWAPLHFVGCLFFHRRSFQWAPLHFVGCLFFYRGSFEWASLHFLGCLFFIGDLLNEPMNERSDSAPLFMAPVFCVKRLSNFQLALLAVSTLLWHEFLGNEALLMLQGT